MGFATTRILKTTNAGTSWTDVTGTLPPAPVDSIVVDPVAHIVYAGTDSGVFSSPTTSATWTEVGPAPGSGTGYIPDAPVTRLRLFNHSGIKILRASTYGRGIWQFVLSQTPDYKIAVPTPALTTYPAAPSVSYAGTATAVGGYTGSVTLSCTAGASSAPSTCTPNPAGVFVPASSGTTIGLAAANATTGDFNFNLHATDGTIVHDTPFTLHVVDFTLGTLSPASVTANVPNSAPAVTIPITQSSNFSDTITFSCSNAPANVTCAFSPNPVPAQATSTTLVVTAATGATPVANFALGISANGTAHQAPAAKTKTLTLTITATPDYTLAIANTAPAPITVAPGQQQPFNGTLTAVNGYNKPVTISCVAGTTPPPTTCLVTTSPTTPTSAGASFTVLTADSTPNTYGFIVHTTDGTITHDQAVTLVVNPDFTVPATTTTCSAVAAGSTSTCMIQISPLPGPNFANAVTYSCNPAGFPNLSTCSFSPASITAGMPATMVTVSIKTTMAVASSHQPSGPFKPSGPMFAFWLSLPAMGIVALSSGKRKGQRKGQKKVWAVLGGAVLLFALLGSLTACGSSGHSGSPGTNSGTYTFNVDAVSNGITHSAKMTVTVN